MTVMQEHRKHEEWINRKFAAITSAICDVHETVKMDSSVISSMESSLFVLVNSVHSTSDELSNLSYMLGSEITAIKSNLHPMKMLEELFTSAEPHPNGDAATTVDALI